MLPTGCRLYDDGEGFDESGVQSPNILHPEKSDVPSQLRWDNLPAPSTRFFSYFSMDRNFSQAPSQLLLTGKSC